VSVAASPSELGEIGTDMLVLVVALFMGVAILRAVGIVARRLGGGIMYYRMQSHTRRGVTRQYLSLPMEWHQRHPTGQLLSNAYSDVEAAWSPIMPLPMALGTVVMMVIAVVQMFVAGAWLSADSVLVVVNGGRDETKVVLPAAPGVTAYRLLWDSAWERPQPDATEHAPGPVTVAATSLRVYAASDDT
jgi:ABC-type multidrug transport system fused ATPase/permease subunit